MLNQLNETVEQFKTSRADTLSNFIEKDTHKKRFILAVLASVLFSGALVGFTELGSIGFDMPIMFHKNYKRSLTEKHLIERMTYYIIVDDFRTIYTYYKI